jgi:hypothetical protein
MLPKDVAHQDKVCDTHTQCIPPHTLAAFIRQKRDKQCTNEWQQDNRGKPGKLIRYHDTRKKYLFLNVIILLNFVNTYS